MGLPPQQCPLCNAQLKRGLLRFKIAVGERAHCNHCYARLGISPRVWLLWLPMAALIITPVVHWALQSAPVKDRVPLDVDWPGLAAALACALAIGLAGHLLLPLHVNRLDPLSRRAVQRFRQRRKAASAAGASAAE